MAFDDPGGQNRKVIWYDLPIPVTLSGTVYPGDVVGYSSGWKQADADGGIRADFVAVEQGDSGDKVTVAVRALVDGYTDGTAGDQLYVSNTAGEISVTTSPQKVGKVVASGLAMVEPVVYIEGGTFAAPILSAAAGETFRELWARCTGAGHVYGERVYAEITNAAATSSNAIRAELGLYHTSGAVVTGGSALHAATYLGPTNTGVAGLMAGLNASIIVQDDTRSLAGTYAALSLQTEFKAGNTMPANSTSFIRFADTLAIQAPLFFDTSGMASASDGAWETDSGGVGGTVLGYYKVRTAAGNGYMVVYSSHS